MFVSKKKAKSELFQLRLSEKQKQILQAMAIEHNMNMSELINTLLEIEFKFKVVSQYQDKL